MYALAISNHVIQYLTEQILGAPADLGIAAEMAKKQMFTSHVLSHTAYTTAGMAVAKMLSTLLAKVHASSWYTKHKETADYITSIPWNTPIEWISAANPTKEICVVDGVQEKRCTTKNAAFYRALRTVTHPAAALCMLADKVPKSTAESVHVHTTRMEMHHTKTLTPEAALQHGTTLRLAVQLLETLL